jgi:hypothetical protein
MDRSGNTLYIGGNFDRIGQTPVEYLAAIDTSTGMVLPTINLDFDGVITNNFSTGVLSVDEIEVTSDDRLMVVVGNFMTINGISRHRLALLELGDQAVVSTWNTDVFDVQCPFAGVVFPPFPNARFPQYIKGIDISPDDSYLITGTTGFRIVGNPACDTIARFELDDLTDTDVQPTWVSYTGGDSVYEVAASEHAVYAGGHFRTLNNGFSPDNGASGPGAVARAGLAALDPLNGLPLLNWQSDRSPRGLGTFALEVQPDGLYIGDDTNFLNGFEHPRFKFLPLGTELINRPDRPALPATVLRVNTDRLEASPFDGTSFGIANVLANSSGVNFRGAMFVGGQLIYGDDTGTVWRSRFNGESFDARRSVNLFGLTDAQWQIDQIGGMFFDYEWSRVYYTLQGDSRLFWRAFTPDGPLFGDTQYVAEHQGDILWSDVSGMDVINGYLYFGRTDGYLYRAQIDDTAVVTGTTSGPISGPAIDGRRWNNNFLAFFNDGEPVGPNNDAELEIESFGSQTRGRFRQFEFPMRTGEPAVLRLAWDDPTAKLNLFVRDADGLRVAADNTATGSPKWLTVPAGAGGTYTANVLIREGSTDYTLQVNPVQGPPEPLADYVFNASGDQDTGRFQRFNFDVNAGDLVDAEVIWDNQAADTEVRVFLRNENGTLVERNIGNTSPARISVVAQTSGRWSLAVLVRNGAASYDVLINTINENPVILGITNQPADVSVQERGSATFYVTATGSGALSYQWLADGEEMFLQTRNSLTVDAVRLDQSGTVYTVQVTDDNGSTISDNATLIVLEDPNLALKGTATQSTTGYGGVPGRAIDGNTSGVFGRGSVTSTLRSSQPWWEVRLPESMPIESINVYNRTDCCTERLSDYTVSILDDDRNTVFSRNFSDPPLPSTSIAINGIAGRTVRVQLNGTGWLSLAEVQVIRREQ